MRFTNDNPAVDWSHVPRISTQPLSVLMPGMRRQQEWMDASNLRLSNCTRWPERANCDRACLSQAVQAKPYTSGGVKVGTKQIYHLPIVLAAFVAWYLGAIWHSQYMFRTR